jgi:hypothetical protein
VKGTRRFLELAKMILEVILLPCAAGLFVAPPFRVALLFSTDHREAQLRPISFDRQIKGVKMNSYYDALISSIKECVYIEI